MPLSSVRLGIGLQLLLGSCLRVRSCASAGPSLEGLGRRRRSSGEGVRQGGNQYEETEGKHSEAANIGATASRHFTRSAYATLTRRPDRHAHRDAPSNRELICRAADTTRI